jgi:hypothetical protein
MKKTLIIIFLALSIVSQGQTFSTLLKDRTKSFNVIDYGATEGGTVSDVAAIQSASNTLTLDDGTGLALSGQWVGATGDSIDLIYSADLDLWVEISRSNN